MKNIFNLLKHFYLIPWYLLNIVPMIISRKKNENESEDIKNNNNSNNAGYIISFVIWVAIGYLASRPFAKFNRIVYACPIDYSQRCSNLEAQYESTCDTENKCFYYYKNIILPNRTVINFYYCDETGKNIQTCYTEKNQGTWVLEYKGKSVFRK